MSENLNCKFSKEDIKPGMVCVLRNGDVCFAIPRYNNHNLDISLVTVYNDGLQGVISLSDLDDSMNDNDSYGDSEFDVMEVYDLCDNDGGFCLCFDRPDMFRSLLWKRSENREAVRELTIEDIEKRYGCKVKIVG